MLESNVIDFPPANIVNNIKVINDLNESYPFIRCEDCYDIYSISLDMNKNEVILYCIKEQKKRTIPFKNFFDNIKIYNDFSCCKLCKEKNRLQKYYLCRTCSNIIICQNCYDKHNKDDDIEKITKIDSICKKHGIQIESYCDICKEHKCSYCSTDHNESHKNKEYLIRDKMIKKNKLDNFVKNLENAKNIRNNIEEKINEVINELKKNIDSLNNLKNKFVDSLNMKIKIANLAYHNYQTKYNNVDINYFLIKNLEEHINFDLPNLNINNENNCEEKIKQIIFYINNIIINQYNSNNNNEEIQINNNNLINDDSINATDITFKKLYSSHYSNVIGFFDFNKDLFVIYSGNSICFQSKNEINNDECVNKFTIKENDLQNILSCQKFKDNEIIVVTQIFMFFITIINNCNYIIKDKKEIIIYKCAFNKSLDLLYSSQSYGRSTIYLLLSPNYNNPIYLFKKNIEKFQFIKNNLFFTITSQNLASYLIKKNGVTALNQTNINLNDIYYINIIDLNDKYYAVNNKDQIYILDKKSLLKIKTLDLKLSSYYNSLYKKDPNKNYYSFSIKIYPNYYTFISKVSNNIVTLLIISNQDRVDFKNYEISMEGIEWELKKSQNLFNENINFVKQFDRYFLIGNNNKVYLEYLDNCKNQQNENLNNSSYYSCSII